MTSAVWNPTDSPEQRPLDRYLLRSFRMAVHVPQLFLAAAAVAVLSCGNWVIDRAPFAPAQLSSSLLWQEPLQPENTGRNILSWSWWRGEGGKALELLSLPVRSVAAPAVELLSGEHSWSTAAFAWTRLIWALLVWGYFGAALTRMTAVSFALDQTVPLKTALRFSARRYLLYLTAPFLPIAGILFFWLIFVVGGWIGAIPVAGPVLLAVLWCITLVLALVVVLILLGVSGGWPLMYATISTEVSDGFDGFSRSFSYVFSRPWLVLRLWAGSLLYGTICVAFVLAVVFLVVHVAQWGTAASMGSDAVRQLVAGSPFETFRTASAETAADGIPTAASAIALFWLNGAALLVHGFGTSLFWSLATVAYFLIRRVEDATALDEVFLTEEDRQAEEAEEPSAAAAPALMTERPLVKDPGTPQTDEKAGAERPPEPSPPTQEAGTASPSESSAAESSAAECTDDTGGGEPPA